MPMVKFYSKKAKFNKYACRLNKAQSLALDLEFDNEILYALGYYGNAYWDWNCNINLDDEPKFLMDVTHFGEGYSVVFSLYTSTERIYKDDFVYCKSELWCPEIFKFVDKLRYYGDPI